MEALFKETMVFLQLCSDKTTSLLSGTPLYFELPNLCKNHPVGKFVLSCAIEANFRLRIELQVVYQVQQQSSIFPKKELWLIP
jgi:hypothetical protein